MFDFEWKSIFNGATIIIFKHAIKHYVSSIIWLLNSKHI